MAGESQKELLGIANRSAGLLRNYYFLYLSYLVFLLIVGASVTDLDFFTDKAIQLPIIGANVPLFGFFVIAPALLCALHVQLYLQLKLLSGKLDAARFAEPPYKLDATIVVDPVLPALAAADIKVGGALFTSIRIASVTGTVFAAPVVLLFTQIVFLKSQSAWVSDWHTFLLIIATITSAFMLSVYFGAGLAIWKWSSKLFLGFVLAGGLVEAVPMGSWRDSVFKPVRELIAAPFKMCERAEFAWVNKEALESKDVQIPEGLSDVSEHCDRLIHATGVGLLDSIPFRYVVLTDVELSATDPTEGARPVPVVRHSRKNMIMASFYRVTLRGADLRWANLSHSLFTVSDLSQSRLRGADFSHAFINKTSLAGASAQGTKFDSATIKKADLTGIELAENSSIDTSFDKVDLRAASLESAVLSGAKFRRSDLRGAILKGVTLTGTNFNNVLLTGADLSQAIGLGPVLTTSEGMFKGAYMGLVEIRGFTGDISTAQNNGSLYGTGIRLPILIDEDLSDHGCTLLDELVLLACDVEHGVEGVFRRDFGNKSNSDTEFAMRYMLQLHRRIMFHRCPAGTLYAGQPLRNRLPDDALRETVSQVRPNAVPYRHFLKATGPERCPSRFDQSRTDVQKQP